MDPRSKVRYLLHSIETDKFDAVKTRIMSDATLRNEFDACVTLNQDFIKQTSRSKTPSTVGISEGRTNTGGIKRKCKNIEDRYFTKSEYDALTADAKQELASKRLKRGHKPGAKDGQVTNSPKKDPKSKDFMPRSLRT